MDREKRIEDAVASLQWKFSEITVEIKHLLAREGSPDHGARALYHHEVAVVQQLADEIVTEMRVNSIEGADVARCRVAAERGAHRGWRAALAGEGDAEPDAVALLRCPATKGGHEFVREEKRIAVDVPSVRCFNCNIDADEWSEQVDAYLDARRPGPAPESTETGDACVEGCPYCSNELCATHGYGACDCDVTDRHPAEPDPEPEVADTSKDWTCPSCGLEHGAGDSWCLCGYPPEPEEPAGGEGECGPTHYAGCACHEARRDAEVAKWHEKAKCYGDMVHGCSPALERAGHPVDASLPGGAVRGIRAAVEALVAERDAARAEVERLREQREEEE